MIVQVAGIPALDPDVTHERCLEELPAFVEEEQASLASALRLYPQVWWHLWICESCAETYRLTRVLAEAERAGEIGLPALPDRAGRSKGALLSMLRLARTFLDHAFSPDVLLLQATRGSDHEPILLAEEIDSDGREVTVSVQPQSGAAWRASVAVAPPPRASVTCTLGEWSGRAPLDDEGVAIIPDIPAALLAGPGGPDLVVAIEADD